MARSRAPLLPTEEAPPAKAPVGASGGSSASAVSVGAPAYPVDAPSTGSMAAPIGESDRHHVQRALDDLSRHSGSLPSVMSPVSAQHRSRWTPQAVVSGEDSLEGLDRLGSSWPYLDRATRFAAIPEVASDQRQALLLRGEDLIEARRLARGRTLPIAAQSLLLASERVALASERLHLEEEQVQQTLAQSAAAARAQARLRRIFLGLAVLGGVLVLILLIEGVLLGQARRREGAAQAARAQALLLQAQAEARARGEAQAHQRTAGLLREAQQQIAAQEARGQRLRRTLGEQEVRAGQVQGDLLTLFKKRITARAARSADTGITSTLVHQTLLLQAWPQLRACYPLEGPLPAQLHAVLVIQPDGAVGEVAVDPAEPTPEAGSLAMPERPCALPVLRALRFPAFAGAHFVRVHYRFRTQPAARLPDGEPLARGARPAKAERRARLRGVR